MDSVRILSAIALLSCAAAASAVDGDRSPIALAVSSDQSVCLTANHTSGSVSLIDLASGRVLDELAVGRGPADLAWTNDSRAIVSLLHDDALVEVSRTGNSLKLLRTIPVGDEPRGLALSKDRRTVYVALGGEDAVAIVDLSAAPGTSIPTLPASGIPKTVRVSPDGRWLITCTAVPATVYVHDLDTRQLVSERRLFDGAFNPGIPAMTRDSQLLVMPHAVNREFSVTAQMIDIGWVIDNRISKLPLPDGEPSSQKQLGLDIRGKAVGDAYAAVFSPDESRLMVTCGGTHELLIIDFPSIPWPKGDPGDFLPAAMQKDPSRFRRIKLGGRPLGINVLDDHTVVVANYLSNSVQVVDLESGSVTTTVELGSSSEPNLAREGEAIFYDADRSMHSWFSCHTCHTDGHTAGQVFDTRNDRSYGTPKLTPSLRGVAETGPWTWHGWQKDLHDAMKRSLTESMSTKQPITDEDATALVAYLKTLDHPANPRATTTDPAAARKRDLGRVLFSGKAGCATCHTGTQFTSEELYDGKVVDTRDRDTHYNPPSLRGVASRRRFLHTGKARSLDAVLSKYHRPEDLVGETLTDEEREALIEFLKSL
ncbi:MAG: c-type cytochrome [Planctomycetes bacterium]|nr:c-type cytochrome [Planctomycetota bacterium]